jgi:A/G-specific adenine glycosylase
MTHQRDHALGRAQAALLAWYADFRRDLPWRNTRDPYAIWLSEIMLQQTRVETVVPYYKRFLGEYPSVHALAEAPLDHVLGHWSGLGYYRRARMLHEAAREIVSERGGEFPRSAGGLSRMRGIGRYTAGAIASIAFGERAALVDGNVARVLSRIFAVREDVRAGKGLGRVWAIAERLVRSPEARDPGAWNQALMELGATVCVPRDPKCLVCPVRGACAARVLGIERALPVLAAKKEPRRWRRVAIVATLRGGVLLGRRREDIVFGGMWEPPQIDANQIDANGDGDEARAALQALIGAPLRRVAAAGHVTHVLSHRRMEVSVLRASLARAPRRAGAGDYEAFEVVPKGSLEGRGISALARKVLAVCPDPSAAGTRSRAPGTARAARRGSRCRNAL